MDNFYIFIHEGGFTTVSGDYTCDPDIVENLGETWDDYLNGKYIMLNDEQIEFYNSNPTLSVEEIFNMNENDKVSPAELERIKSAIDIYDSSSDVNTFYVNDTPIWFDKETRTSLNNSVSIEKQVGKETTVLWINSTPYTLPVDTVKQMLSDIELYAIACYNNTHNNKAEVEAMTLKSEAKSFDITKGYPEKLRFNFN